MRLIVFFDLPVKSKRNRRAYTEFRNFLLHDGYYRIQFSVYGRICGGTDRTEIHLARLTAHLPPKGSVRCMVVTERQYASMRVLVGPPQLEEEQSNYEQLTF